jgi:hypothetical protein
MSHSLGGLPGLRFSQATSLKFGGPHEFCACTSVSRFSMDPTITKRTPMRMVKTQKDDFDPVLVFIMRIRPLDLFNYE